MEERQQQDAHVRERQENGVWSAAAKSWFLSEHGLSTRLHRLATKLCQKRRPTSIAQQQQQQQQPIRTDDLHCREHKRESQKTPTPILCFCPHSQCRLRCPAIWKLLCSPPGSFPRIAMILSWLMYENLLNMMLRIR